MHFFLFSNSHYQPLRSKPDGRTMGVETFISLFPHHPHQSQLPLFRIAAGSHSTKKKKKLQPMLLEEFLKWDFLSVVGAWMDALFAFPVLCCWLFPGTVPPAEQTRIEKFIGCKLIGRKNINKCQLQNRWNRGPLQEVEGEFQRKHSVRLLIATRFDAVLGRSGLMWVLKLASEWSAGKHGGSYIFSLFLCLLLKI